jgi:hypothetical protein
VDNLDGDFLHWMIEAILALGGWVCGGWINRLHGKIDRLETLITEHATEISVLETQTEEVSRRLDRIEQKIDLLLDERRKP